MMRLPAHTLIAWGPDQSQPSQCPVVVSLTPHMLAHRASILRLNVDNVSELATEYACGKGRTVAIDATCGDTLEIYARTYEGPWQDAVRGTCAAILLGRPLRRFDAPTAPPDSAPPSGGDSDGNVPRRPVKPRKGGPAAILPGAA